MNLLEYFSSFCEISSATSTSIVHKVSLTPGLREEEESEEEEEGQEEEED